MALTTVTVWSVTKIQEIRVLTSTNAQITRILVTNSLIVKTLMDLTIAPVRSDSKEMDYCAQILTSVKIMLVENLEAAQILLVLSAANARKATVVETVMTSMSVHSDYITVILSQATVLTSQENSSVDAKMVSRRKKTDLAPILTNVLSLTHVVRTRNARISQAAISALADQASK